jgi:hypothetical protein
MEENAGPKRESLLMLLCFMWGLEFALLALTLWANAVWRGLGPYPLSAARPVLTKLSVVLLAAGAILGVWLLAEQRRRQEKQPAGLDLAFAFLALTPLSTYLCLVAEKGPWGAQPGLLCPGALLLSAYLLVRVVPNIHWRGRDEDEFP